jgi:hypothetical protein
MTIKARRQRAGSRPRLVTGPLGVLAAPSVAPKLVRRVWGGLDALPVLAGAPSAAADSPMPPRPRDSLPGASSSARGSMPSLVSQSTQIGKGAPRLGSSHWALGEEVARLRLRRAEDRPRPCPCASGPRHELSGVLLQASERRVPAGRFRISARMAPKSLLPAMTCCPLFTAEKDS